MSTDPNRFVEGFEAVSIRARIQHDETELAILQQKLDDADEAVRTAVARVLEAEEHHRLQISMQDDARRKRDVQRAELDMQYALFHPVRKVPLEILGYIFEMCLEGVSFDDIIGLDDSDVLKRQQQPFDLAAVCRKWRSASLSYPRAWSRLEIVFGSCPLTYDSKWLPFLDLHIARSCSVPISLLIRRWDSPCDHPVAIIDKLLPLIARCTVLHAYFGVLTAQDPLLPLFTANAPRLAQASIFTSVFPPLPCDFRLFPRAPALVSMICDGFFDFAPAALQTAEVLGFLSSASSTVRNDALRAISAAANLKRLELVHITISPDDPIGPRLTLPFLTALVLVISNDQPLSNLLHVMEFPKLSEVAIAGELQDAICCLNLLRALSSLYRLTCVEVGSIGPEDWQSFLDTLHTLAHLKNLIIPGCALTADTLSDFCNTLMPSGSAWPNPRLRSVDFDDSTFAKDCDPTVVLDLVRARLRVPEPVAEDETVPSGLARFLVSGWKSEARSNLQEEINALISAAAA